MRTNFRDFLKIPTTSALFLTVISIGSGMSRAGAETAVLSTSHGDEDSSIYIQKRKNAKIDPDYEIVAGEEELVGDPVAGQPNALSNWKAACAGWKKELKENRDSPLIYSSCGSPKFQKEPGGSGQYTYTSTARYKMKVRVRDAQK